MEEGAENHDDNKNFSRGADKVQKAVIPAETPAGIQVPLTDLTEKAWIPVYTGMTKRRGGLFANSFNSSLESRDLNSDDDKL